MLSVLVSSLVQGFALSQGCTDCHSLAAIYVWKTRNLLLQCCSFLPLRMGCQTETPVTFSHLSFAAIINYSCSQCCKILTPLTKYDNIIILLSLLDLWLISRHNEITGQYQCVTMSVIQLSEFNIWIYCMTWISRSFNNIV